MSVLLFISSTLGSLRAVIGEGMPIVRNPFEKGNLYIKFEVTFPPKNFANEMELKVIYKDHRFLVFARTNLHFWNWGPDHCQSHQMMQTHLLSQYLIAFAFSKAFVA